MRLIRYVCLCSLMVLMLAFAFGTPVAHGQSASSSEASSYGAFEASWPRRSESEVSARIYALSKILLGRDPVKAEVDDFVHSRASSPAILPKSGTPMPWQGNPVSSAGNLVTTYHPDFDDLRVSVSLPLAETLSSVDVGETSARKIAAEAFERVLSEAAVDRRGFDFGGAEVSFTRVGFTAPEGQMREIISEYTYSVQRRINGVPLANAGIRVTVHRSGTLLRLRVGGLVVRSQVRGAIEIPMESGRYVVATVKKEQSIAKLMFEVPNARVVSVILNYAMPENTRTAVIEPMYLITFTRVGTSRNGERPPLSARETWGYKLDDPTLTPVVFGSKITPSPR